VYRSQTHSLRDRHELREQFIAILGHDLRNPHQAVTMTSALMEVRAADAPMKELATRILTNARRMSRLTKGQGTTFTARLPLRALS
jgi:signal transduction histidine kinase